MNYHDPSSHSQESCDQSTYSYYSYSYSHPNPQFSSNIHPYSYPNPIVQPSQHEEQEPNPPGVTPPPPPEQCRNSYYQHQAHGVAAGVPTVSPHPGAVAAGPAVAHQPIVQPKYGGSGIVGGMAPGGDARVHRGPELNVLSYPFHGRGCAMPMNAAVPFHDQMVIAYGGLHVQGGSSQLPSQPFGETRHSPGRKVLGCVYRVGGRGKGYVPRRQGKSDILGGASQLTTEPGPAQPASVLPPSKAVCCELCKVECNTLEVLEQHMSGKKHKKKLKIFEELKNLNKVTGIQTEQTSITELKSEVPSQPAQQEVLPSQEIKVAGGKRKVEEIEPPEVPAKKTRVGPVKRKLKSGKLKPSGRSKSSGQPPKPKEVVVPLICELCNVKCESLVVFQSHLAGKKHNSKAKHFLSQATSGQELLLQAQRPAMPAVNQNNSNASTSTGFLLHDQGF